jgi:hypothetical protein
MRARSSGDCKQHATTFVTQTRWSGARNAQHAPGGNVRLQALHGDDIDCVLQIGEEIAGVVQPSQATPCAHT